MSQASDPRVDCKDNNMPVTDSTQPRNAELPFCSVGQPDH